MLGTGLVLIQSVGYSYELSSDGIVNHEDASCPVLAQKGRDFVKKYGFVHDSFSCFIGAQLQLQGVDIDRTCSFMHKSICCGSHLLPSSLTSSEKGVLDGAHADK